MRDIIAQITWRDFLDIALVSFIIYEVLVLFARGTKTARMLIGLMLLLLASIISRNLPLYTLDWLLQEFLTYLVIALIVIFQPEIRRTLARVGATPFLAGFSTAEELKGLEELVKAAVSMAERRIGGLIVIEREGDLKDFIELGTMLDAKVSRELLLSVFHPSSPIHDGAAIIRGNRVVAAGCFLPLAMSADISKTLGTRHRAALGLVEETDAVVIIISEETGMISVASSGKLETRIDMGTLRDMLNEFFSEKKAKR